MKILIDISEEKYKRIKYMYVHNNPTANEFKNTILNGEIIEKLPSVTPQQGWECPKCNMVYAPWVSECFHCGNVIINLPLQKLICETNTEGVEE